MEEISQSEIEEVSEKPSAPIADDSRSGTNEHSAMAPSSADMPGENILQNKVAGDLLFWTIFHQLKSTGVCGFELQRFFRLCLMINGGVWRIG